MIALFVELLIGNYACRITNLGNLWLIYKEDFDKCLAIHFENY